MSCLHFAYNINFSSSFFTSGFTAHITYLKLSQCSRYLQPLAPEMHLPLLKGAGYLIEVKQREIRSHWDFDYWHLKRGGPLIGV